MNIAIAAVYARDWVAVKSTDKPLITANELTKILRSGIAAIDIRVESLRRGPSAHEIEIARQAHALGVEVRCHSWVGDVTSGPSKADGPMGLVQGEQARAACRVLGATRFGVNAENSVWRGPVDPVTGFRLANPKANDFLASFAVAFRIVDCPPTLEYLGYANPAWHYRRADLDRNGIDDNTIEPRVRKAYDTVGVMTYQSSIPAHDDQLARAQRVWPEHFGTAPKTSCITPWVGVGRIDKKSGQIGNADASITLARRFGRLTFYVGGGAMGQLLRGHPGHRSIVQIMDELKPKVQA
jgi:hypothetical protein